MYDDFWADKDKFDNSDCSKDNQCFDKTNIKAIGKFKGEALSIPIGPLQLAIVMVQNRHAGTPKSHWDKTNKGNYHLKLCTMPFVGLALVRLFRPRMAVFYQVNGKLQRAYY